MITMQMVPIKKIHVLNPRARNKTKFAEIVANISKVGLKKPVTVCPREGSGGEFDLVCGQGRLEAFARLGETHVPAIVAANVPLVDRYLISLVENLGRRKHDRLALARGIAELEQQGYNAGQIAAKIGYTETYVRGILKLHAAGEELLLGAVERGEIPFRIAIEIAQAKDGDVKRCLAEAYEKGELKGRAIARARVLLERRSAGGRRGRGGQGRGGPRKKLGVEDAVRVLKRATHKQAELVRKAKVCESLLRVVTGAVRQLARDEHFVTLLRAEGLDKLPKYLADQVVIRGRR